MRACVSVCVRVRMCLRARPKRAPERVAISAIMYFRIIIIIIQSVHGRSIAAVYDIIVGRISGIFDRNILLLFY